MRKKQKTKREMMESASVATLSQSGGDDGREQLI